MTGKSNRKEITCEVELMPDAWQRFERAVVQSRRRRRSIGLKALKKEKDPSRKEV
jgi:hypothetical protein